MNVRLIQPGEKGYDSAGHPHDPTAAKKLGLTFKTFYIGKYSKADSLEQIKAELDVGTALIANFEASGDEWGNGTQAGIDDANKAIAALNELNYPKELDVFFSCDTGAYNDNYPLAFSAAESTMRAAGFKFSYYGGKFTLDKLRAHLINFDAVWNPTRATSWGVDPDADISQFGYITVDGVNCDLDICNKPILGWSKPNPINYGGLVDFIAFNKDNEEAAIVQFGVDMFGGLTHDQAAPLGLPIVELSNAQYTDLAQNHCINQWWKK